VRLIFCGFVLKKLWIYIREKNGLKTGKYGPQKKILRNLIGNLG
jgi:hypothetical protein